MREILHAIDDLLVLRSLVDGVGKQAQSGVIHELFSNNLRGRTYDAEELRQLSTTNGIAHLYFQGFGRGRSNGSDQTLPQIFEEAFPGYAARIERAGLMPLPASNK
jgi:hypothetical protein